MKLMKIIAILTLLTVFNVLVSHFPNDQQVKKGEIICTKKCKKWVAHTHISI